MADYEQIRHCTEMLIANTLDMPVEELRDMWSSSHVYAPQIHLFVHPEGHRIKPRWPLAIDRWSKVMECYQRWVPINDNESHALWLDVYFLLAQTREWWSEDLPYEFRQWLCKQFCVTTTTTTYALASRE